MTSTFGELILLMSNFRVIKKEMFSNYYSCAAPLSKLKQSNTAQAVLLPKNTDICCFSRKPELTMSLFWDAFIDTRYSWFLRYFVLVTFPSEYLHLEIKILLQSIYRVYPDSTNYSMNIIFISHSPIYI